MAGKSFPEILLTPVFYNLWFIMSRKKGKQKYLPWRFHLFLLNVAHCSQVERKTPLESPSFPMTMACPAKNKGRKEVPIPGNRLPFSWPWFAMARRMVEGKTLLRKSCFSYTWLSMARRKVKEKFCPPLSAGCCSPLL